MYITYIFWLVFSCHTEVFHQFLGEVRIHVPFQAIDDGDHRALSASPNLFQERLNTAGKAPMVQKQERPLPVADQVVGRCLRADYLNSHIEGLLKSWDNTGGRAHGQDARFR